MQRWQEFKESPRLRANLEARARILAAIRAFFDGRGYLEMETPLMVAHPGMEPYLDPFETELQMPGGRRYRGFLITSPEYSLKKLLAAGFERIYQLGRCFRNGEDSGGRHNPEFTMLEWYRVGTDYVGIMDETEELVRSVAEAVGASLTPALSCKESTHLCPPLKGEAGGVVREGDKKWERLTVRDAMKRYAGVDLDAALDDKNILLAKAAELGHQLPPETPWDDAFFAVFLNAVEPKLGLERPTFLYEYPISMASLSRPSAKDPRYAERFELYVAGLELANAFSELTDADVQRQRLEEEHELRKRLGKTDYGLDEEFLDALRSMPAAGGISIGVDRLVMILLGETDIRQVQAFPADSLFGET
jgi:lysyl-tRNA synthetase class 2